MQLPVFARVVFARTVFARLVLARRVLTRSVFARPGLRCWAVAALLLLSAASCSDSNSASPDKLDIVTASGQHRTFNVEVVSRPEERERGLMYRQTLASDAGMLFDFQQDASVSMWMKNTFIPLDMVFITADGTVVKVAADTVPQSLETIPSGRPIRAVLEIKGGEAARQGIAAGDHVRHPVFKNAP
jgi:uncharacterized membrane protein (UPF0127 family)